MPKETKQSTSTEDPKNGNADPKKEAQEPIQEWEAEFDSTWNAWEAEFQESQKEETGPGEKDIPAKNIQTVTEDTSRNLREASAMPEPPVMPLNAAPERPAMLPAPAPEPHREETGKTLIEEPDGTTIEIEDADSELNAILAEEIANFDFVKITFQPRSTISCDILRNKMLPEFCGKEDLNWKYDGKTFTVAKKMLKKYYEGRTMAEESRAFLTRLLGFFAIETNVE